MPRPSGEVRAHAFHEALALANAGIRQLVLLGGEPGIGKTHTVTQFATSAHEHGALVLWGSCYEWDGAPAYWPWIQALGSWLRIGVGQYLDASAVPVAFKVSSAALASRANFSRIGACAAANFAASMMVLLMSRATDVRGGDAVR